MRLLALLALSASMWGALGRHAYVTMASSEDYLRGAAVLAKSIQNSGSPHPVVILTAMPEAKVRQFVPLQNVVIQNVDEIALPAGAKPIEPRFRPTLTKLKAWTLTQFKTVAWIDSDVLVLRNIDDIFAAKELSGVRDIHCSRSGGIDDAEVFNFNGGLFVLTPSNKTYEALLSDLTSAPIPFQFPDQELLRYHFKQWSLLSEQYCFATEVCSCQPSMWDAHAVRAVHFTNSARKPWKVGTLPGGRCDFVYEQWDDVAASLRPNVEL